MYVRHSGVRGMQVFHLDSPLTAMLYPENFKSIIIINSAEGQSPILVLSLDTFCLVRQLSNKSDSLHSLHIVVLYSDFFFLVRYNRNIGILEYWSFYGASIKSLPSNFMSWISLPVLDQATTHCMSSVGIHEHCTVAEILVFGRETSFPIQTLRRWYMQKSHQEMETNLT